MEKKDQGIREIVDALGLKNIPVVHKRAEELEWRRDYILGRAVTAPLPQYLDWMPQNLHSANRDGLVI